MEWGERRHRHPPHSIFVVIESGPSVGVLLTRASGIKLSNHGNVTVKSRVAFGQGVRDRHSRLSIVYWTVDLGRWLGWAD